MSNQVRTIFKEIAEELESARASHGPLNSPHEAYAVMLEELDEYKEWVWMKSSKRNQKKMRAELVQLAAMAIRTILDVHPTGPIIEGQ